MAFSKYILPIYCVLALTTSCIEEDIQLPPVCLSGIEKVIVVDNALGLPNGVVSRIEVCSNNLELEYIGGWTPDGSIAYVNHIALRSGLPNNVNLVYFNGDLRYIYLANKNSGARQGYLLELAPLAQQELFMNVYQFNWATNAGVLKSRTFFDGTAGSYTGTVIAGAGERLNRRQEIKMDPDAASRQNSGEPGKAAERVFNYTGNHFFSDLLSGYVSVKDGENLLPVTLSAQVNTSLDAGSDILTNCIAAGTTLKSSIQNLEESSSIPDPESYKTLAAWLGEWAFNTLNKFRDTDEAESIPNNNLNQLAETPDASNSFPQTFQQASRSSVSIGVRDNGNIDNDIIDLMFNGSLVEGNISLGESVQWFPVSLQQGVNYFEILVKDDGVVTPGTTEIRVDDGTTIQTTITEATIGASTYVNILF